MSKKVLLVDDEADFLELMSMRVKKWGYDVLAAKDGKEALSAVENKNPDIVILDFMLPDMDGASVLRQIRKFNKDIPVIMFTAFPDKVAEEETKGLGVSAVIPKLSMYSEVLPALESTLNMISKKLDSEA